MTGEIPDLSGLRNLKFLDLSENHFSGSFPAWVGNLTSLVSVGLAWNDFEEGGIPESIGNLKNLTLLYLAACHLKGEIPDFIFHLSELETLDFSRNKISGEFPKSISKLQKLVKIELFDNNLSGELPPELANLTFLQEFDISKNQIHGKLPPEIGNLKHLTVFQLYENKFSGEFPAGFGDMKHLFGFSIYRNSFSGEFPANLGRFSPLNSIDISENQFSGNFPKYFCANKTLQLLLALGNNFSGEFPDSYSDCKSLQRLRISSNGLSGELPNGIWAIPFATIIDFGDNNFSGNISPQIGISTSLNQLLLLNNKFSGPLPPELGKLTQLQKLSLSNNNFSGIIPSEFSNLKQLSSLHLEENSFTGQIPSQLGQCNRLADLNLASNSLSGHIPKSLSLMVSLNSLNLSRNKLTGLIPKNLQKLKLSFIDLSENQLSGKVPFDMFMVGGVGAFTGNNELCVDKNALTRSNSNLAVCKEDHIPNRFIETKLFLVCIVLFSIVVFLSGLLFVSYKNFKLNESFLWKDLEGDKKMDPKWKLESFHQVEFDAEELCNLEEMNLIGCGGTGKVYRLDLKKTGGTVAVKQLWKGNMVKVLDAEMGILGKIRHRNILKLYACLKRGGSSFLVFEYMSNGNLFEALHQEMKGGKSDLDWNRRYRIALGSAKGIAYLHHDCSPPIIHRDIKSTNILLDEEYEPKIADFGVAKIAEESPRGSETSSFAGTHGYIAPEMAHAFTVTEKSDVYSFGVVLLELVTGKKPLEDEYGEGKDIVYWVQSHFNERGDLIEILDPRVVEDESIYDNMIKVLRVATLCTTKLPSLRPSMRDVVKMLVDADPSCSLKSPYSTSEKYPKVFR